MFIDLVHNYFMQSIGVHGIYSSVISVIIAIDISIAIQYTQNNYYDDVLKRY